MEYDKLKSWAWDIECFRKFFSAGFRNMETDEYIEFEISEFKNEARELFKFMSKIIKTESITIGFNSMFYDQPMMHYFLRVYMSNIKDVEDIHEYMFAHSQWLIHEAERFHRERDPLWQDIDLYKCHHYDNRAKSTSLKKIQVFLKLFNIMESSVSFDAYEISFEEAIEVMEYQEHDVLATKLFADYSENEIIFRFGLIEKFGKAALNYSDSKIGSELMNKELIDKMGYDKIYKMVGGKREPIQTHYPDGFDVGPLMFDYIQFESPAGKAILEFFKSQKIKPTVDGEGTGAKSVFNQLDLEDVGELSNYVEHVLTNTEQNKEKTRDHLNKIFKESEDGIKTDVIKNIKWNKKGYPVLDKEKFPRMNKYSIMYWDKLNLSNEEFEQKWPDCKETFKLPTKLKHLNVKLGNLVVDLGVGGCHASVKSGIYSSDKKYVLIDADAISFYTSISIENFLAPKQYDPGVWVETYGNMKKDRVSYPKGSPENKALKLALNSTYGNSSNKFSPIRDPAYTIVTCLVGSCSLMMLMERWLKIPGLMLMSANTDGANAAVPVEYIKEFIEISKEFEKLTRLDLECSIIHKMNHRDVNNFLYEIYDEDLRLDDLEESVKKYMDEHHSD